jgi:hypothetical protein
VAQYVWVRAFLKTGNCVFVIFSRMVGVVFTTVMFGVTVLLVILGVSSHEGSLSSLLVLVGGFHLVQIGCGSSILSYHLTQSFDFMGLQGLEAPCVTVHCSLGYWVVHATNGHMMGYIAYFQLCFISALLFGWPGEP